jgi:hypothetical protein
MSSRSLAAARARRAGENPPPVSGNRPITSIGSQAAFANQMPPTPTNIRVAKSMPPKNQPQQKYQQPQSQETPTFSKISISDAIGLITLRLGRVEQWIIDNDDDSGPKIPGDQKLIDNSIIANIVNRLDSIEKCTTEGSDGITNVSKLSEDFKTLTEQVNKIRDDVAKHTIELAKNTEQIFKFNRELTETKDILKSFMIKYDTFYQETLSTFQDYEFAIGDIEKRIPNFEPEVKEEEKEEEVETTKEKIDSDKLDLKNLIKQELLID